MAAFGAELHASAFCEMYSFPIFFRFIFIARILLGQKCLPHYFLHIGTDFPFFAEFLEDISDYLFIFFLVYRAGGIAHISHRRRIIQRVRQYLELELREVENTLHLIFWGLVFQGAFRLFLTMEPHTAAWTAWVANDDFDLGVFIRFKHWFEKIDVYACHALDVIFICRFRTCSIHAAFQYFESFRVSLHRKNFLANLW